MVAAALVGWGRAQAGWRVGQAAEMQRRRLPVADGGRSQVRQGGEHNGGGKCVEEAE